MINRTRIYCEMILNVYPLEAKSIVISDIFSIGLKLEYVTVEKNKKEAIDVIIYRCNGKHEHQNKIINNDFFDNYHIHTISDKQLKQLQDKNLDAEQTATYNNYDDALMHFLNECNISDSKQFFEENSRLREEGSQLRLEGDDYSVIG